MAVNRHREAWEKLDELLTCPDVETLRKVLVRQELFKMTLDVPGDIVECGVFKGSGLMLWVKLMQIYCPGAIKRVVGFDTFGSLPELEGKDSAPLSDFFSDYSVQAVVTHEQIEAMVAAVTGKKDKCFLVKGNISKTAQEYADQWPGARICLMNMDLDLEEPTLAALEALWPLVSRGGIIVFDEYAIARWSESRGVDQFLAKHPNVVLKTFPWARTPTAYCIKP